MCAQIKTADRAENMDGCKENRMQSTSENSMISLETDDEIDYSNHDIDPNIESDLLEQQIPVQNHSKYPDQDSPDNIWLLPSGKPIDEVIRGPGNLHKSQ